MKVLKAVVKVVAIVATVASLVPGPWQPIAATVAAIASVASAALEVVSPTKATPPQARGSPTQYQLDPQAGIPYAMGRTQFAGNCVKRETWGTDNMYQCFTSVYSLGPINAIEAFQADRTTISFNGAGAATTASVLGFMWFVSQLGACPSPLLASPVAGLPGWDANSKMSGLAASHWVLKFDTKGKKFTGGPPQPGVVMQGVKVYDPRLDSTYPGGSGACRAGDETTYVYSETPHLHALTFALGRYQNGKRRMGIGFPVSAVDVSYFANAANVDEANGWKVGGIIYSTDGKWNTLKMIMEAGGGAPIQSGGLLTGIQRAPKTTVATITGDEIVGASSVVATQSIRDRINIGIPRYRSEAHGWEYVSADPCRVAGYVATDGDERQKEYTWTLVQQARQAAQLTFYEVYDARELSPIELRLKIRWVGLKPGDCVTLNIPAMNLNNQKVVVLARSFDVETGAVTMRFRTETDQKHTDALAALGAAPPVQSLSFDPDYTPPAPSGWTMVSGGLSTSGGTVPTLRFVGAGAAANAQAIEFLYRKTTDTDWSVAGRSGPDAVRFDVSTVAPGTAYMGRVRYVVNNKYSDPVDLGPLTVENLSASGATVANSIVGQGALATKNTADFASDVSGSTKPANNATVGADINLNVGDSFTGTFVTVPRNEIKTSLGIASGFAGQGSLATQNSLAYGGAYLSGFGPLAARSTVRFGNEVYRANNTTIVADADAITSLGTAAGFAGQGSLATQNSLAYGGSYLTGFGSLAARSTARIGAEVYRADGSTVTSDAMLVTSLGNAAGFAGQGALATLNAAAWGSQISGRPSFVTDTVVSDGAERLNAYYVRHVTLGRYLGDFFPAQAGADVTNTNIAAGFAGQGALATKNQAGWASDVSGRPANLSALSGAEGIQNTQVAVGQNQVVNSGWDALDPYSGMTGWSFGNAGNTGFTFTGAKNLGGYYGNRNNVLYATLSGTPTVTGNYFDLMYGNDWTSTGWARYTMKVNPGDRVFMAALLAVHRCTADVGLIFYDDSGSYVYEAHTAQGGRAFGGANGDPANFDRVTGFFDIPTAFDGAIHWEAVRQAVFFVRGYTIAGQGSPPYVFATQPMMCKVPAGHTTPPPYTVGPVDRAATYGAIAGPGGSLTNDPTIAGSGARLGDQRNMPAVSVTNLSSRFVGDVTWTANSSSATISVSAGPYQIGSTSISLNAMSVVVPSSYGPKVELYIANPTYAGGSFTLVATTDPVDLVRADGRMWIGEVNNIIYSSGQNGTGGVGGGATGLGGNLS